MKLSYCEENEHQWHYPQSKTDQGKSASVPVAAHSVNVCLAVCVCVCVCVSVCVLEYAVYVFF